MKPNRGISLTPEQVGELMPPIITEVLALSPERVQYWIGRKRKLAAEIRQVLAHAASGASELLTNWQNFYVDVFGLNPDFSNLRIPEKREGFDRLIVIAQGMTPNKLYAKCVELFPSWRYTDNLDLIISDRKADHDYAIWVRDRVEADEELKNKSANTLKEDGVVAITLEERLLYELKFFEETGKHLDISNWTLCAGSRDPNGNVPSVCWSSVYGNLYVDWCSPDERGGGIRGRAAVL